MESLPSTVVTASRPRLDVDEVPPHQEMTPVDPLAARGTPSSTSSMVLAEESSLIFCSVCGVDMPGADLRLLKMLCLRHSVNRLMLYNLGCFAGGTVLRIAKDIAENNPGARVLVVCSESAIISFRAPSGDDPVYLVTNMLFGDGAAAAIIGTAPPNATTERPIFQIISASQSVVPDSDSEIEGHYREVGLTMQIKENVPDLISTNLEGNLVEAFRSINFTDWNSIFWVAHPGGRRILDCIEARFALGKERLGASRHVLEEFGNMASVCVFFILDKMRKKSIEEGKATTGEGMEWGVLLGFGPGLTIETVVLRSVPIVAG